MVSIPGWKLYSSSVNNALRIDGVSDVLALGTPPAAPFPLSFTCYARIVVDRNNYSTIFSVETVSGYNELVTEVDGTTLSIFDQTGGGTNVGTVGVMTVGTWYKIGWVLTSGAWASYIGLEGGGLTKTTGSITNATGALTYCGLGATAAVEWFNGRLSMPRVWEAALSDAEIAAELASPTPVRTSNLLGAWIPQTVTAGTVLVAVSGTNLVDGAGAGTPSYTIEAGPTL